MQNIGKILEKIFHKFLKFLENREAKGNIEKWKNTHSETGIGRRLLVSSFDSRYCPMNMRYGNCAV